MRFTIRPSRHFPVKCSVTYNARPFQGQGTVWNLSCTGWRLSGDFPLLGTQEPPTHRFIKDLMDQNFHLVLDVTASKIYARNGL